MAQRENQTIGSPDDDIREESRLQTIGHLSSQMIVQVLGMNSKQDRVFLHRWALNLKIEDLKMIETFEETTRHRKQAILGLPFNNELQRIQIPHYIQNFS